MNSGLVFDIQRFSLNDGPGIRTTVFLKGCLLHCDWCHNPESQSFRPQLMFNSDKCMDCFECVKACPNGVHQSVHGKHVIQFEQCNLTGECVEACPQQALKISGEQKNVEEIMRIVLKDKEYYLNTGGGLTISGGEPMAQFEFTKALLTAAKREGLHTSLDTCGIASTEKFKELIPLTDLFLYDYKLTDDSEHKRFTGAGNRQVLENLDFLMKSGAGVILRCPIIPGINDNEEHLEGIAELVRKYPGLKSVEILPYHTMGRSKFNAAGMDYKLRLLQPGTEDDKARWIDYFKSSPENPGVTIR